MKEFNKFWFKPPYQRDGKPIVEFELLPMDQRTFLFVQGEITKAGRRTRVSVDAILEVFSNNVTNWRGLEKEFSESEKRAVINGVADPEWGLWQTQITGELYQRAIMLGDDSKNS